MSFRTSMKLLLPILFALIASISAGELKPDPKMLGPNLIINPSLEKLKDGAPVGWSFRLDNTQYKCKVQVAVDEKEKAEGQRSVRIFNFTREESTKKNQQFGAADFLDGRDHNRQKQNIFRLPLFNMLAS
jgi:hypothetical protein